MVFLNPGPLCWHDNKLNPKSPASRLVVILRDPGADSQGKRQLKWAK